MHYLLFRDLLRLLGMLNLLQFTQFIAFIMDIVIYWDVQEMHYFTQFIAHKSVGLLHIAIMPQFIVHYLLWQNLLGLPGFLNAL